MSLTGAAPIGRAGGGPEWGAGTQLGSRASPALVASAPGLHVHPTVEAAARQAGAALQDAGYAVEEVEPPSIEAAAALWAVLGAADTRSLAWPWS